MILAKMLAFLQMDTKVGVKAENTAKMIFKKA